MIQTLKVIIMKTNKQNKQNHKKTVQIIKT